MNDDDKVIAFPGGGDLPQNLLTIKRQDRYSFCKHERILLDEHTRTVNCRDCAAVLDAFNFLRDNARTLQMAWQNHASATTKVAELAERIDALTKEYKRIQGRVSRARDKVPVVDTRGKDRL